MIFEKLTSIPEICSESEVKLSKMGNICEVQYMSNRRQDPTIKPLDKDRYLVISTGELREFQHFTTRKDNVKGLFKTFAKLRALINTNCEIVQNCRWCTLTYAENMTDKDRLYRDFQKFNQRFQYYCEKNNYGKAEYIVMCEPQGRGAWHMHLLYIWNHKAPFIPNQQFQEIWGMGFVKIGKLDDTDNVGAYLTAYLTDMELHEINYLPQDNVAKSVVDENGNKKSIIKGARLSLYPKNFHMYRCSRGIRQPDIAFMTKEESEIWTKDMVCNYESAIKLTDEKSDYTTLIIKQQYKVPRSESRGM